MNTAIRRATSCMFAAHVAPMCAGRMLSAVGHGTAPILSVGLVKKSVIGKCGQVQGRTIVVSSFLHEYFSFGVHIQFLEVDTSRALVNCAMRTDTVLDL